MRNAAIVLKREICSAKIQHGDIVCLFVLFVLKKIMEWRIIKTRRFDPKMKINI